jgi:hypothetical protein
MDVRSRLLIAVGMLGSLVATGCGPKGEATHAVTGEVRFDGQLVERGSISFIPQNSAQRTATSRIENGTYELLAPAGVCRVEVMATRDDGPVDPAMGQAPQRQYVPDRYNVESELTADVQPKSNSVDFDLRAK